VLLVAAVAGVLVVEDNTAPVAEVTVVVTAPLPDVFTVVVSPVEDEVVVTMLTTLPEPEEAVEAVEAVDFTVATALAEPGDAAAGAAGFAAGAAGALTAATAPLNVEAPALADPDVVTLGTATIMDHSLHLLTMKGQCQDSISDHLIWIWQNIT
jgi:hypothetical protein